MIYHDTQQWQICPLIVHYRDEGVPISKYTNDRRWWEQFAAQWGRLDSVSFTPVRPTEAQQDRLAEINNAGIPSMFGAEASGYVERGVILDPENEQFSGFTEAEQEVYPDHAPIGTLQTDKWSSVADSTDEALVAYATNEESVQFVVDDDVYNVDAEQRFNGKFAILEISADATGPIRVEVRGQGITIAATEA